ncbi:MAG: DegV family protein [Erysipelotrichales bacterium]|nr:DegV family protein [Erysipelotrichales bacterium]
MIKTIVTCDSTIAISPEKAKEYDLRVLPLNVIVDNVEYHDGVDINYIELAKMMRDGKVIKTSTPTPYEIEQFFDKLFEEGYEKIVHFTISSKLSSMFDLFTNTCQNKYGDKVVIVDSLSVMSFMLTSVLTAKKLIEKDNMPIEKALEIVKANISDFEVVFIPESLTFLKRGGRISPAVAFFGNLIGLKPVLGFVDGAITKIGTTRNIKVTLKETALRYAEMKKDPEIYKVAIASVDANPALIEFIEKLVKEYLPEYECTTDGFSVNVEAHAGPGTIALIMERKPGK